MYRQLLSNNRTMNRRVKRYLYTETRWRVGWNSPWTQKAFAFRKRTRARCVKCVRFVFWVISLIGLRKIMEIIQKIRYNSGCVRVTRSRRGSSASRRAAHDNKTAGKTCLVCCAYNNNNDYSFSLSPDYLPVQSIDIYAPTSETAT